MTAPFVPLDPRGTVLGDEVYARLGEAILDGQLAPGERLRDQELAERLGVSRTPVREALQRLERTGIVEVAPNRYTRVSTPNDKVQADVFEFVAYLMGIAVRMAVARCSDEELADALIDADDMIEASRADDHEALASASHAFFTKITLVHRQRRDAARHARGRNRHPPDPCRDGTRSSSARSAAPPHMRRSAMRSQNAMLLRPRRCSATSTASPDRSGSLR